MSKLATLLFGVVICLTVAIPWAIIFYLFRAEILRFVGDSIIRGIFVSLGLALVATLLVTGIGWAIYKIRNRTH
jgi:hypothetical protein